MLDFNRAPPAAVAREQSAIYARLFKRAGQSARDFAAVIVGKARVKRRGNAQRDGIARRRIEEYQRVLLAGEGQFIGIDHRFVLSMTVYLQMKS